MSRYTEEERKAVEAQRAALLGYEKRATAKQAAMEKTMRDPIARAEYEVKRARRIMASAKTQAEKLKLVRPWRQQWLQRPWQMRVVYSRP